MKWLKGRAARMVSGCGQQTRWQLLRVFLLLWLLGHSMEEAQGGTFVLPLEQTTGWQFLKYRKIPPNTFRSTSEGLVVGVTNSAAPAVFPLTNELRVVELNVSGHVSGSLRMPLGKQGKKGYDDYVLRVGLVERGTRTLNWRERMVAADWVTRLFALAPRGTGIHEIHFFNVGTEESQLRDGPVYCSSGLMQQTVVAVPDTKGHFAFTKRFTQPLSVIAVWISCDGDDTDSRFAVTIERVALSKARSETHMQHQRPQCCLE